MSQPYDLRLGIDVGGTNTDAALLDASNNVIATAKTPTTAELGTGITAAIAKVLEHPDATVSRITHVMLGTTRATNAILERRALLKTAVVRIGAPATMAVEPLFEWPSDLKQAVLATSTVVGGGSELTGRDIADFDRDALERYVDGLPDEVQAIAITGVYSPVNPAHELEALEVVQKLRGEDFPISLSKEIGSLGLLERENACVLNASLFGVAREIVEGLTTALVQQGIHAAVFFSQNDGTLMGMDYVLTHPVLTIGSGPTNSMRGAAFLTGVENALVADVGGTSTDVGVLTGGFPRESSAAFEIGGVATNFRMPDLVSIAVGGGTILRGGSPVRVGPDSVGYRIIREALTFGGGTPTLTDAALARGRAQIPGMRAPLSDPVGFEEALAAADALIAEAVDMVKTARTRLPLVAVGGGSMLISDVMAGVTEVLRPDHFDVANAVGAAIASVSGQVDKVYRLVGGRDREAALKEAASAAYEEAVKAGADPHATEIVEIEEVPMAYLSDPVLRIRAKAAGPLGDL